MVESLSIIEHQHLTRTRIDELDQMPSLDPILEVSELLNPENSSDSLRSFLKEMKFEGYNDAQIWEQAKLQYPKWRDENAFVVIARLTQTSVDPPSNLRLDLEWVPQKRRGSVIYCDAVWGKFQPLLKAVKLSPQSFSPASLLTLTSDASRGMQWNLENIEKGWNHILTLIRQRVGRKVHFLKVVELTKKGHAHIHAILFNVPFVSKAWLSSTWNRLHHAYIVDIAAVRNLEGAIDYLLKHQQKILRDVDAQAYFWFHQKRSWTTSRGLLEWAESFVDLIQGLSNSKDEFIVLCIRLKTVTIDQAKDPPEMLEIPLTREDMMKLREFESRELVEPVVIRIVAGHLGIPTDWIAPRFK